MMPRPARRKTLQPCCWVSAQSRPNAIRRPGTRSFAGLTATAELILADYFLRKHPNQTQQHAAGHPTVLQERTARTHLRRTLASTSSVVHSLQRTRFCFYNCTLRDVSVMSCDFLVHLHPSHSASFSPAAWRSVSSPCSSCGSGFLVRAGDDKPSKVSTPESAEQHYPAVKT